MNNISKIVTTSVLLLVFMLMFVSSAEAIPAFARRYKLSCSTCHLPFPRLKPYGDEFAGNGFIIPEEEKERDYVTGGDDLLWLNKDFPIAGRFEAYSVFDTREEVDKDLQIPWGMKLMSGGTLFKNIGYYFYFYMSEKGEVAGIEDAYLHFDNIFGSGIDIMAGQFQTSDPLMKRELRLTFEDYMIYKQNVGESGTNLTYDRGVIMAYTLEKTGTDLVGLVVNGNGKGEAGEEGTFDTDPYKNWGVRINQGFGDLLSVGFFYYKGKEKHELNPGTNSLTYWGPDFNIDLGLVNCTVQLLKREDTDPMFDGSGKVVTDGTVAELVFLPQRDKSRFFFTGLYNNISSDFPGIAYETATLSGTYTLARNLRLMAEYTRDLIHDKNRFVVGTVTAF
ncbi:hypothetical protein JXO52_12845 [bacterium]|nr:hypothetical protein [bacterium]